MRALIRISVTALLCGLGTGCALLCGLGTGCATSPEPEADAQINFAPADHDAEEAAKAARERLTRRAVSRMVERSACMQSAEANRRPAIGSVHPCARLFAPDDGNP